MSVEYDAIGGVKCDSVAVNRDFQGGRFLKKEDKGKKGTF